MRTEIMEWFWRLVYYCLGWTGWILEDKSIVEQIKLSHKEFEAGEVVSLNDLIEKK